MEYHRGRYIQRGRGIGSLLSSFFRTVLPIVKSIGSSIIKSPITKEVLTVAKNSAIDAGLNIAADVLSGENVASSVREKANKVSKKVATALRSKPAPAAIESTKKAQKRKAVKVVKKKSAKKPRKTVKRSDIYDMYN